jgi:hypothetical protein
VGGDTGEGALIRSEQFGGETAERDLRVEWKMGVGSMYARTLAQATSAPIHEEERRGSGGWQALGGTRFQK